MKRTYITSGIILLAAILVWLVIQKGCKSSQPSEQNVTEEVDDSFVQDPNFPCPNDPLVTMNLAAPSPVSGNSGALFGCRRYANISCNLSVGNRPKRHRGLDLLAPEGTDVYAMYSGKVISVRNNVGCDSQRAHGNRVLIESTVDGEDYIFYYCHLSNTNVVVNSTVTVGQVIGKTGKTGNACYVVNPHLHVEIKRGDSYYEPQAFMTTRFDNNGNISQTCRQ